MARRKAPHRRHAGSSSEARQRRLISEELRRSEALHGQIKIEIGNAARLIESLRAEVKSEIGNATRQIEAYLNLQAILNGGFDLPPMHGWPVSPDLALLLVRELRSNQYDLIVEFGSGTSTVLMAETLRRQAQAGTTTQFVAFEHLEKFENQTRNALRERGLEGRVDLRVTPLLPHTMSDGKVYPYYECEGALKAIAQSVPDRAKVLVVVDGPPAGTAHHARFPAFPVVYASFPTADLHFILDDYIRLEEQQIAKRWEAEAGAHGLEFESQHMPLEKGAYLLRLRRVAPPTK